MASPVIPAINASTASAPGFDGFAITPSDTTTFFANNQPLCCRAIYVGVGGTIVLITAGGTTLTFLGVTAGQVLPVMAQQVKATGTTATNLIGII